MRDTGNAGASNDTHVSSPLTPADYTAGRKAFEAWLGKPWPSWGASPWLETVISRLIKEGRFAGVKGSQPPDEAFVLACDRVNTEKGGIAYRMPGAKTIIPIQFIAGLLTDVMVEPTPVTPGSSAADIAAAEKRGRDQVKAAVLKAMEGL